MIGLVLEGGGAKGSYHIGAYKAILEEGIQIQGITGTSIGALNGAMIVQGDFDLCYELWEEISYSMVINTNDDEIENILKMKPNKEDLIVLAEKFKNLIKGRGFDITPFKKLLNTYIDEDRIRNSPMDFGMVTINLSDLMPVEVFVEDIPKGELNDYLLASAYLPVFKMERLGGKIYLDGGFYDNLPFNLLVQKGYNDLILVRTHATGFTRRIDKERLNATIISPSSDIGRSYSYEAEGAKRNIQLGYYDGLRALRGLCGNTYCIEPKKEKYYLDFLLSIDEDKINRIKDLLHISSMPERRLLFEYIIPKLGSIMGLNRNFTYEDFLISLLEEKAKDSEIDRFKIYSFEDLLDLIKCKGPSKPLEVALGPWEKIIEKIDLSTMFNKEEVILEVADIIFCE